MSMVYDTATQPTLSNYTYSVSANNQNGLVSAQVSLSADETVNGKKTKLTGTISFNSYSGTITNNTNSGQSASILFNPVNGSWTESRTNPKLQNPLTQFYVVINPIFISNKYVKFSFQGRTINISPQFNDLGNIASTGWGFGFRFEGNLGSTNFSACQFKYGNMAYKKTIANGGFYKFGEGKSLNNLAYNSGGPVVIDAFASSGLGTLSVKSGYARYDVTLGDFEP